DGAGRIVGGADDDHAGAVGDGIRHRVEVVPRAGREGDLDAGGAGDQRQAGVRLEGAPGVDDLVTDRRCAEYQLVQDRDAAGGDVTGMRLDAEALAKAGAQRPGRGIRIAVDGRGVRERLEHRGQRLERVLVTRELE